MTNNKENLPFSKRYGYEPIEIPFQIEAIDNILRTELWNTYYIFITNKYLEADGADKRTFRKFHKILWIDYFKLAIDDFPRFDTDFFEVVRRHIELKDWFKVYNLFEFILSQIEYSNIYNYKDFTNRINLKLRENNSAYTLNGNKFIPITNELEINELKQTLVLANNFSLNGIQQHLNSAIEFFSLKPSPDYRNSIKESISMVESIARIIEPNAKTLGEALNKLDLNQKINGTFKSGFEKLYAYTNGKHGIRHAIMEEQTVEFEDAKFFLIACSAFTNYLVEKARKDNLLNGKE